MIKRRKFNPKRRIAQAPAKEDLAELAEKVQYGGNAAHKRNPGDFGLPPPLGPRPGKTLCDDADVVRHAVALDLLQEGIRRGLVSKQMHNGFPQNIWSVSNEGIPLEAELENAEKGTYHGYPMPEDDGFRLKVIQQWDSFHE